MQKWEYRIVEISVASPCTRQAEKEISELGAEGWELVGVSANYGGHKPFLFFKRAIPN